MFRSLKDVPSAVFDNLALVVERFLPEMDGDLFCVRSYVFRHVRVNFLKKAREPIVKSYWSVSAEEVPVPTAIVETQRRLGLDYGKLDYVIRDGEPVLLDVNATPATGKPSGHERWQLARRIADGIDNCFDL